MADSTFPLTPAAIAVPALGLITLILDSPPLIWHIRNRNFGASSLVSWIILCNLMNFINSLIWPTDDIKNWWNGKVLCDIEVKLMTAVYIGVVGSLVSIMRSLARVLDTENTVLYPSTAQKRRQNAIDCLVCIGAPIYMMLIHYIVQPSRYYIYAISGCVTSFDNSWPKLLLVFIWPPIFCLVVVGYSVLVIHRMRKYRKNLSAILNSSNSSLTRNRFLRLFWMSMTLIVVFLPVQAYVLYQNSIVPLVSYDWSLVHGPLWGDITVVPTGGTVIFDRWVQIAFGFTVFLFFGLGHDAVEMYRTWLLKLGLERIFPSLRRRDRAMRNQNCSTSSQAESTSSRARLFITKKFSRNSTLSLHSKEGSISGSTAPLSPTHAQKLPAPLFTISENDKRQSHSAVPLSHALDEKTTMPKSTQKQQSWLHSFLINTHLAAPNRHMGGGLGGFGVIRGPRSTANGSWI